MSIHPVRRTVRLVFWPLSRPLAAGLIWSHRHTVGLWVRSFRTELTAQYEGSFSPSRLRLLATALWRVSSDPRFRNDPTVRRLTIDSELVEVNLDERVASLQETLADLPGIVTAEIDDMTGDVADVTVNPTDTATRVADSSAIDRLIAPSR